MNMKVEFIGEAGHVAAFLGMGLSYGLTSDKTIDDIECDGVRKAENTLNKLSASAHKLAGLDGGHNKFLESIVVWIDITAPRYFWSQFDTYRVGTSKQSESTMHTIMKRHLTKDDFSDKVRQEIFRSVFRRRFGRQGLPRYVRRARQRLTIQMHRRCGGFVGRKRVLSHAR